MKRDFLPGDHINQVGILENNGKVTVDFNDELYDDTFAYRIQYAYVPREMFITSGGLGESSGTDARNFAQKGLTGVSNGAFSSDFVAATCCLYGKVHAPFATRLNIRRNIELAAQIEEAVAMG